MRALLDNAAANRNNFQQLRPLAGWMCLCACVCEINKACIAALPLSLLSLGSGRTSTSTPLHSVHMPLQVNVASMYIV